MVLTPSHCHTLPWHIGVQQHEPSPELLWQSQLLTLQVLVGSEQELVRLLVVAHLLLLEGPKEVLIWSQTQRHALVFDRFSSLEVGF